MSEAGLRPPLLLLLPLVAVTASLAGPHGNACPAPCRCHRGLLNCSRAALPAGLHWLLPPGPAAHNQTFFFLILKDNDLSKLQKDSLEGLLSLKHLDLSCNKILFIEKHAFEPLPFLQYINLGGNLITELRYGTFQAWHGMQFLQKLVLSHNPLSIIADTSFFELPSLKYLDLGATQVTQKTFQTLLMTSLQLETLILPNNMACCLCQMKENIEILCKTIKLHCEHLCATNSSLCEPLEKMQEELMKVLQSRKLNASIVLNLEPEEPLLTNSDDEITMLADSQYQPKIDMDLNKSGDLLPGVNYLFFKHLTKQGEINNKAFHRVNSDVSHMLVERKQKHRMNSKEGVSNRLSHRKSPALTDAVLENPSENNDSSLDDILPSIHQANETHWKHQKESAGFPYTLSGSSSLDNYSVQGDLFEAELNNRLRSLIPNQAVRNLISHVIRTLKMDCTEPRVQLACAKLISKTGLLMKLFSEREDIKETSSLWRTYLWENRNAPNESTHQRKTSKKDSEELSPEPPQYSYGNKLLLAISVTVVIMIIIAVICLIEVSQKNPFVAWPLFQSSSQHCVGVSLRTVF
ncbi:leucine-rich repeat-containing protein 37A2-like [Gopherus flavomarginatus]|uniref:leucine-rich repeat-containing protein 37A2-like n=1 Tax=Gopherus flavomarginatus TaxID=286002 RepID=UPI0021CBC119|nr:leucine-rich repeat-containing protein 37A2-like [Gopherus flavomarginatus]